MTNNRSAFEACLAETIEATKWKREEALVRISDCRRRLGISYEDYCKMRMYRVEPKNQAAHYERLLKQRIREKKERNECILTTMEATGWNEEEALQKIKACRDELGISYRDYMELEMYNAASAEQAARYEKLREKREKEKRDRRKCISAVMTDTDCTREEAIQKIEESQERLGVSYRDYRKLELWKLERSEQKTAYREYKQTRRQERIDCIAATVEATGWTEEDALERIKACRDELSISYRDYRELRLWEKTPEEQQTLHQKSIEKTSG